MQQRTKDRVRDEIPLGVSDSTCRFDSAEQYAEPNDQVDAKQRPKPKRLTLNPHRLSHEEGPGPRQAAGLD